MNSETPRKESAVDLVGVALIPDSRVIADVVDFAERWSINFGSLGLSATQLLPHISLHQIRTSDSARMVEHVARFPLPLFGRTSVRRLLLQPPDWIFLTVDRLPWMQSLQADLVSYFDAFVDRGLLRRPDELHGYSPEESSSYLRHGYRYVGDAFLPHFTIGRSSTSEAALPLGCHEEFSVMLRDLTVSFARLVVFRAGPHGTIRDILFSSHYLSGPG